MDNVLTSIKLQIISPKGILFDGTIESGRFPGEGGEIGVLPNHSNLVSTLKPGVVELRHDDETSTFFFVPRGTIEVTRQQVTLLVPFAEKSDSINRQRAESAFQRAQERLDAPKNMDISRAYQSRLRAQERLAVLELGKE